MKKTLLFLLLFTTAMPSLARAEEPNPLQPFPQSSQRVRLYKDLVYVPNGHDRQKLDLYVPENSSGLMPLIVWIHGGGWMGGSKNNCPPLPWTRKGYVVASIDYRLSQDAKFPAQIEDCKAAVRWLRVHASEYGNPVPLCKQSQADVVNVSHDPVGVFVRGPRIIFQLFIKT